MKGTENGEILTRVYYKRPSYESALYTMDDTD